jgi:hypothetical protein
MILTSIFSGSHVVCYRQLVRAGTYTWKIDLGIGRIYDYQSIGGVRVNRIAQGAGVGGSGWAWTDTIDWIENGFGDGWEAALARFMGEGRCTYGWEIWVDTVQKCDEFGNVI